MMQDNLLLERQGDALIIHSKHNRWHGALGVGFALFWLTKIYGIGMPDQNWACPAGYWLGVVIGVALFGFGVFLLLPREIITTFDLRSHRVVHHVSIGRGWYERRRTHAFAEIAGLRLNEYHGETHSYTPVMTLRNGETRWLSTANGSYLICAMTIEAICAVTGLPKLGVAR